MKEVPKWTTAKRKNIKVDSKSRMLLKQRGMNEHDKTTFIRKILDINREL